MSSGTSTLNRHLEVTHKITRTGAVPIDPKQTNLRDDGNPDIHNQINDVRKGEIPKSLVEFIVYDKQTFSVGENDSFRKFVYSLNRFYKLPSRRTIVRAIDDVYKDTIVEFRRILESIPGRVALTCDGWSSRIMRGYFVVTLHWICNDWRLRSSVL
jgi:hypothetical protein